MTDKRYNSLNTHVLLNYCHSLRKNKEDVSRNVINFYFMTNLCGTYFLNKFFAFGDVFFPH